jgi:hypothetical protein
MDLSLEGADIVLSLNTEHDLSISYNLT